MRERLIKLYYKTQQMRMMRQDVGQCVDFLFENGVVCLPCKIGSKMYVISKYYGGEWKVFECKVNDITVFESNIFISLHGVNNFCFGENAAQIGKTIFFTREEAEAKLKGVEQK